MKEITLQNIWSSGQFKNTTHFSVNGNRIRIVDQGFWNKDSGPDFINAKVEIDNVLWFGNIEIHVKSSNWLDHKHDIDEAYSNVILHVVFEHDLELNESFQTIELKNKLKVTSNEIENLKNERDFQKFNFKKKINFEDLARIRLKKKSNEVERYLFETKNDWQETFYLLLCKNFGFRVNAIPFELLARSLPFSKIRRQSSDLKRIESLLFGQAGMLKQTQPEESYTKELIDNYQVFKYKYGLHPINKASWKYLRMRPLNFPSLRIAQLSSLLKENQSIAVKSLEVFEMNDARVFFGVSASQFWNEHYSFKKRSNFSKKEIGESSIQNLMINTIVPFQYTFAKIHGGKNFELDAMSIFSGISPENNSQTRLFKKNGVIVNNALESQAIMELKSALNF